MPDTTRSGRPRVQLRDGDVHAVGRRAVDFVDPLPQPLHPQRPAQRQRVADRARFDVRRDDGDLAQPLQRGRERMNALGVHAVVVGHQDFFHAARDKYNARDSGFGTRDSGLGTRDSGFGTRVRGSGFRDWLLATGYWRLATGYWRLWFIAAPEEHQHAAPPGPRGRRR